MLILSVATIDPVLYFALSDHPLRGEGAIYAANLLLREIFDG
jgi:hypothetical protein